MQEQGVRHDDPEYLKAHTILSAVQKQQMYHKQRLYAQQQQNTQAQQRQQHIQQQQQHLQQLNGSNSGDATPNGINGNCSNHIPKRESSQLC